MRIFEGLITQLKEEIEFANKNLEKYRGWIVIILL